MYIRNKRMKLRVEIIARFGSITLIGLGIFSDLIFKVNTFISYRFFLFLQAKNLTHDLCVCVCSSGRQDIRRGRRHKRVDGMKADEPWQNSYISIPGGLVLPPSSSSLLYIPSRFLLCIFFLFRLFYNFFFFVPSEFVVLICFFLALIYKTVMVLVPMSRRLSPCCVRSIHRDLCTTSIHFSSYSLV